MNSEIEEIFGNIQYDNKPLEYAYLIYRGKNTTYVTYQSTGDRNTLSADDEVIAGIIYYDIDIYSDKNFLELIKKIKQEMKKNGYVYLESSPDMYEKDTGLFHKTLEFAKEKEEI